MTGHGHCSRIMERAVSRLMWFQRRCSVPVSDCLCIGYWILVQLNILILSSTLPVLILGLLTIQSPRHLTLHVTWLQGDDGRCKYLVMLINRHSSFMLQFL